MVSKAVGKPPGPAFFEVASRGFSSKAPPAPSTPAPQYGVCWRRWAVRIGQRPAVHCRPPHWLALAVTGAPAEAQRSGFGGERRPSGGNELSGLPGSERSVAWADDAAPRAARIAVTPQALRAAALYRLRPPGRHRCHAPEIPRRSPRVCVGLGEPVRLPGPLSLPCSVGRGLAPAACPPGIPWGYTPILLDHSPSFGGVFF